MWFFFFKQKTAYEMRISDWSSDVCSSDLLAGGAELLQGGQQGVAVADGAGGAERLRHHAVHMGGGLGDQPAGAAGEPGRGGGFGGEIGRASCRERVCQYG